MHTKYGYSINVKCNNTKPIVSVGGGFATIDEYITIINVKFNLFNLFI